MLCTSCTVYYPDQQMHNIYIINILYSQALLLASMHLHHHLEVLTLYFAKVTKLLKLQLSIIG